VSLALFNDQGGYIREFPREQRKGGYKALSEKVPLSSSWNPELAIEALKRKHLALKLCCETYEKLGYKCLEFCATILTPLVIGLGNEHPTEKGFRFDWNLGIPSIPASSIKGVARLAHLVGEIESLSPLNEERRQQLERAVKDSELPDFASITKDVFGTGGEKTATRGKMIILDAYPRTLPKLKAEIMNCHYSEYLGKGSRGPTEDQQPNPQRYWAVDTKDRNDQPLEFVFRLLLDRRIAEVPDYRKSIEDAMRSALREHGLGAKTAVGHGRLKLVEEKGVVEPAQQVKVRPEGITEKERIAPPPVAETRVWESAFLEWNPGKQELTAGHPQGGRAFARGLDLVPEPLRSKLEKKRKVEKARVTVGPIGDKFRIIGVEEM
jgi:CRISPR-associated protein Cmr6